MALNLSTSWSPPPTSALNISNCTAAAAYVAWYTGAVYNVEEAIIFDFFSSAVPLNWTDSDHPTDGELILWVESWDQDVVDDMINKTTTLVYTECGRTICRFFQLEGDPDLAGLGMMVSYYLVAVLATIYVVVISLDAFVCLKTYETWRKIHSWFEQTLNSFLDTSLLFSISMLLASIYRFSSAARHPEEDDNTFLYALMNAMLVGLFSTFPPLLLQFTAGELRRRGMRVVLWFIIIVSVIAVTILYYRWLTPSTAYAYSDNHTGQYVWLAFCDLTGSQLRRTMKMVIFTAQIVLGLNLPCWINALYAITKANKEGSHDTYVNNGFYRVCSKLSKRYKKHVRALDIIVCCATMWVLLGTFTAVAGRLAESMGVWGKDREWSIGQVLAVATFAPLIIDIIAVAIYDPRKALEGKLPRSFSVVESAQPARATDDAQVSRRFTFHNTESSSEYEMLADQARMN